MLDHELFYLVSSMPILDERSRQVSLQRFMAEFNKSKNKRSLHPTTKQTFWSTAILALHRGPSEEIIGVILKMLRCDLDFNQILRSNSGDVHSAVLVASGLFCEKTTNLPEGLRWKALDTLLRHHSLNLDMPNDERSYASTITDIVWKYKSDHKDCKRVIETLRKFTGDTTSSPVALFNEQDAVAELKKLDKDTVQRTYLQRLIQSGVYRKAHGTPVSTKVEHLMHKFPNFEAVVRAILPELALYKISADPLFQMMPILLVGDPGIGKTRFVHALATTLNLDFKRVDCGGLTAHWVLSGMNGSWKDAKPGEIATSLIDGNTINPLVMLDEIDKMSGNNNSDPFNVLHNLIEKDTARTFKDECLGIPINASHISWLATANSIGPLPNSIQSRFRVINIPAPTAAQMPTIINSIYEDLLDEYRTSWGSRFAPLLRDDVIELLKTQSPRDMKKQLLSACGTAAMKRDMDIYEVLPSDIDSLEKHTQRIKVGFHN